MSVESVPSWDPNDMTASTDRNSSVRIIAVLTTTLAVMLSAPPRAHATDVVRYEVMSVSIASVNVEYADQGGRTIIDDVPLPWSLEVTVDQATGPIGRGAQVRADWRPQARPSQWVTVRILHNGVLLCQSTLDVGNATCYGNTPHNS